MDSGYVHQFHVHQLVLWVSRIIRCAIWGQSWVNAMKHQIFIMGGEWLQEHTCPELLHKTSPSLVTTAGQIDWVSRYIMPGTMGLQKKTMGCAAAYHIPDQYVYTQPIIVTELNIYAQLSTKPVLWRKN